MFRVVALTTGTSKGAKKRSGTRVARHGLWKAGNCHIRLAVFRAAYMNTISLSAQIDGYCGQSTAFYDRHDYLAFK